MRPQILYAPALLSTHLMTIRAHVEKGSAIPLISLTNSSSIPLYLFYHNHITTPSFFVPRFLSHSTFIMSLPLFAACDSSCKAETNGFAGTRRGCQLGDLGTQRSAASSSSTASCFVGFLSKRQSLSISRKSDVSSDSQLNVS